MSKHRGCALLQRVHDLDVRKLQKVGVRRIYRADAVFPHQHARANVEEGKEKGQYRYTVS